MEKENNEKKNNRNESSIFLQIFCNYSFWLISIIFLEFSYRIIMNFSIDTDNIINIVLYAMIISSVLSIISRIFNNKANNWIISFILLILGVIFSIQCVFTKIFTSNFSLSNLALRDQAAGFIGDALNRYFK